MHGRAREAWRGMKRHALAQRARIQREASMHRQALWVSQSAEKCMNGMERHGDQVKTHSRHAGPSNSHASPCREGARRGKKAWKGMEMHGDHVHPRPPSTEHRAPSTEGRLAPKCVTCSDWPTRAVRGNRSAAARGRVAGSAPRETRSNFGQGFARGLRVGLPPGGRPHPRPPEKSLL